MKVLMPCAQEIYGELRAEERDDYLGTAPVYMILRGEQVVGYVFWDGNSESWRYGQSPTDSAELPVTDPREAVEQGLRMFAAELADAEGSDL